MSTLSQFFSSGGAPVVTANTARTGYQVGDVAFASQANFYPPTWLPIRTATTDETRFLQASYPELVALLPVENKISLTSLTQRTFPNNTAGGGFNPSAIVFGASLFVAASSNTLDFATSPDGVTWTLRAISTSPGFQFLDFQNSIFVASYGQVSASSNVYTSSNGTAWTLRTMPSSQNWGRPVFGNSIWVCVANEVGTPKTVAASSPDGVTWTARTMPTSLQWRETRFANGVFVAVASGSASYATSTDGITWTARTLPAITTSGGILGVANNTFYVQTSNNGTYASTDGINWSYSNRISTPPIKLVNGFYSQDGTVTGCVRLSKAAEFYNNIRINSSGNAGLGECFAYGASTYVAVHSSTTPVTFGIDESTSFCTPLIVGSPTAPLNLYYVRAQA